MKKLLAPLFLLLFVGCAGPGPKVGGGRVVWKSPQDANNLSLINLPAPVTGTSPLRLMDSALTQRSTVMYRISESNSSSTCTGWLDITTGPNVSYACSGNAPSSSAIEFPAGGLTPVNVRLQVSVTAISQTSSYTLGVAATRNGTTISSTQCNYNSSSVASFCDQGIVSIASGASTDVFGVKLIGGGSGTTNSITATATLAVTAY